MILRPVGRSVVGLPVRGFDRDVDAKRKAGTAAGPFRNPPARSLRPVSRIWCHMGQQPLSPGPAVFL